MKDKIDDGTWITKNDTYDGTWFEISDRGDLLVKNKDGLMEIIGKGALRIILRDDLMRKE